MAGAAAEEDFVAANLLDGVIHAVGAGARAKGLDLLAHLDPSLPAVLRGDALRLCRLLVHLAREAIRHTSRGGVVVAIERGPAEGARIEVRFSVTDTGGECPVSPRSWRFSERPDAQAPGAAPVSARELDPAGWAALSGGMEGRAVAENVPGGVLIRLDVPLAAGGAAALRDTGQTPGRRVLVIDDSEAFSALIAAYIGSLGHEVGTAGDAASAVRQLLAADASGRPYDLLVVDWQLPETDGIALARRIGALDLRRRPTLALVTGAGVTEAEQASRRQGVAWQATLEKPVTLAQVREALRLAPDAPLAPA